MTLLISLLWAVYLPLALLLRRRKYRFRCQPAQDLVDHDLLVRRRWLLALGLFPRRTFQAA